MADQETTTVNLANDITVNGRTFKAGQRVTVPKGQADDVARMDHEHTQYLLNLNKQHKAIVDSGTIAVGGSGA